jgi:hypothetical protein
MPLRQMHGRLHRLLTTCTHSHQILLRFQYPLFQRLYDRQLRSRQNCQVPKPPESSPRSLEPPCCPLHLPHHSHYVNKPKPRTSTSSLPPIVPYPSLPPLQCSGLQIDNSVPWNTKGQVTRIAYQTFSILPLALNLPDRPIRLAQNNALILVLRMPTPSSHS